MCLFLFSGSVAVNVPVSVAPLALQGLFCLPAEPKKTKRRLRSAGRKMLVTVRGVQTVWNVGHNVGAEDKLTRGYRTGLNLIPVASSHRSWKEKETVWSQL